MRGFQSYLRNCITDLNRKLGYNQSKIPWRTLLEITKVNSGSMWEAKIIGHEFYHKDEEHKY